MGIKSFLDIHWERSVFGSFAEDFSVDNGGH